jgi:hypothetical protein
MSSSLKIKLVGELGVNVRLFFLMMLFIISRAMRYTGNIGMLTATLVVKKPDLRCSNDVIFCE